MFFKAVSARHFNVELVCGPQGRRPSRMIVKRTQDSHGCRTEVFLEMSHHLDYCDSFARVTVADYTICSVTSLPTKETAFSAVKEGFIFDEIDIPLNMKFSLRTLKILTDKFKIFVKDAMQVWFFLLRFRPF